MPAKNPDRSEWAGQSGQAEKSPVWLRVSTEPPPPPRLLDSPIQALKGTPGFLPRPSSPQPGPPPGGSVPRLRSSWPVPGPGLTTRSPRRTPTTGLAGVCADSDARAPGHPHRSHQESPRRRRGSRPTPGPIRPPAVLPFQPAASATRDLPPATPAALWVRGASGFARRPAHSSGRPNPSRGLAAARQSAAFPRWVCPLRSAHAWRRAFKWAASVARGWGWRRDSGHGRRERGRARAQERGCTWRESPEAPTRCSFAVRGPEAPALACPHGFWWPCTPGPLPRGAGSLSSAELSRGLGKGRGLGASLEVGGKRSLEVGIV